MIKWAVSDEGAGSPWLQGLEKGLPFPAAGSPQGRPLLCWSLGGGKWDKVGLARVCSPEQRRGRAGGL